VGQEPAWRFWKREKSFVPASPQPSHCTDYAIPVPSVTYMHVSHITDVCTATFHKQLNNVRCGETQNMCVLTLSSHTLTLIGKGHPKTGHQGPRGGIEV
jgi:hypothetical protein